MLEVLAWSLVANGTNLLLKLGEGKPGKVGEVRWTDWPGDASERRRGEGRGMSRGEGVRGFAELLDSQLIKHIDSI